MAIDYRKSSQLERGDWKVYVSPEPWGFQTKVYLVQRVGLKDFNATIENGVMKMTEVQEGVNPDASFLRVPSEIWQLLVDAISESTPPTKETETFSELKATKYHLEDMRMLALRGVK